MRARVGRRRVGEPVGWLIVSGILVRCGGGRLARKFMTCLVYNRVVEQCLAQACCV